MRTDQRYTRVKAMITHPSIPRNARGVLRLCRSCQREVYFVGGFLKLLNRMLYEIAKSGSTRHGIVAAQLGRPA